MSDLRPPEEWQKETGIIVWDPDGWRSGGGIPEEFGASAKDWDEPISLEEFKARCWPSTCKFPEGFFNAS